MHRCIVCNTIQPSENVIFAFSRFSGSAQAQVTWGDVVKRLLIAYIIRNITAKKYQNLFKVIASQRWDVFWDTVYMSRVGIAFALTRLGRFLRLAGSDFSLVGRVGPDRILGLAIFYGQLFSH